MGGIGEHAPIMTLPPDRIIAPLLLPSGTGGIGGHDSPVPGIIDADPNA